MSATIEKGTTSAPKGQGPRRLRATCVTHASLNVFWVPNNVVKYDGNTNPNVWLEDYHLACTTGGADDDLFII
jgi:hypothetical protein